jgi:hypothetical protein
MLHSCFVDAFVLRTRFITRESKRGARDCLLSSGLEVTGGARDTHIHDFFAMQIGVRTCRSVDIPSSGLDELTLLPLCESRRPCCAWLNWPEMNTVWC